MNFNIGISLNQISGERLMEPERGIQNLQITTNISITKLAQTDNVLDLSFIFAVNYSPALANLTLKGSAKITGDKSDLEEIRKAFEQKKALPPMVLQTISNVAFVEGVILARSLNIPPPIPLPAIQQQNEMKGKAPSPSYIA